MSTFLDANNHLFVLARKGRWLPNWLVAILMVPIFLLLPYFTISSAFFWLVGRFYRFNQLAQSPYALVSASELVLSLAISFLPSVLLVWLWLKFVEKRPFWTLGLERQGAVIKYLRGILVGFVLFAAVIGILLISGGVTGVGGDTRHVGLGALGGVLLTYTGWTLQGPTEEIVTRGWLLPVLGARYKPGLGIAISSLIFGLMHSLNSGFSLLALFNLVLFGLLMALYALNDGSLWGVFSIHAAWNWAEGNVFGTLVSGFNEPGGQLFVLRPVGPGWLTGAAFGPEGGLAVMLVLLAGIACVVLWGRAKNSSHRSVEAS
jgi:membrane protease YdiL (CAAX protease family)